MSGKVNYLDKSKAIHKTKVMRLKAGPRYTYVFKCSTNCGSNISVRSDALKIHSGMCVSCSHQKKPFESIYNSFINDYRKLTNNLTYDQFIEFTKEDKCHYCSSEINWIKYGTVNGKYTSRAYNLDRKDSDAGYSKENCVVCCSKCNKGKLAVYSYEEWFGMTKYFRDKI